MTNTTENLDPPDGILKVDRLGRVQAMPERREGLLEEFEKSAMSAKAFAEHYGIKYQTFCGWRHQRRKALGKVRSRTRRKPSGQCFTLALAEVAEVPEAGDSGALEIELAGGHRLVLNDAKGVALAAELIQALERPAAKA